MKVQNVVVRGYSLKPENVRWLKDKAARRQLENGEYTSASAVLDEIVDEARAAEAREKRILREVLGKAGVK